MSGSASPFPLLLPQPQEPPHPLFLYHSSPSRSATPFFHISIHLSSSPSHHRSKSESVFTQSRVFSGRSESRRRVRRKKKKASRRTCAPLGAIFGAGSRGLTPRLYLPRRASSQKKKKKIETKGERAVIFFKKKEPDWKELPVFFWFTWVRTPTWSGPARQNSTWRLFKSWSVSLSAV